MSFVAPPDVVDSMLESGETKTQLSAGQLVLRAAFSVFLLAGATVLAITATEETGVDLIGALLFPMGLVIVVLLNVELLTGNFALVPLVQKSSTNSHGLLLNVRWLQNPQQKMLSLLLLHRTRSSTSSKTALRG